MSNTIAMELPNGLTIRGNSIMAKVSVTVGDGSDKEEKRKAKSFKFVDEKVGPKDLNIVEAREKAMAWKREVTEALTLGKELLPETQKVFTLQEASNYTYDKKWSGNKNPDTALINVGLLTKFFGPKIPINEIDGLKVNAFVSNRTNRDKVADGTINRQLTALNTMLKTCWEDGYYDPDGKVPPKMPFRKEFQARERYITREEEALFINFCERKGYDVMKDIFILALRTALRREEMLSLLVRDVFDDSSNQVAHVTISAVNTKNSKSRNITVRGLAREILLKRMRGKNMNEKIFEGITPGQLRHWWDVVRGKMGLGNDPQFVLHICRHTCLSRLSESGMQPRAIQQWAGHQHLTTTQRYLHPSRLALEEGSGFMEQYDKPNGSDEPSGVPAVAVAETQDQRLKLVK
jgi:integrase